MGKFINPFTDVGFKRLSEIAEVASLNKEERQKYDESLRQYRNTPKVFPNTPRVFFNTPRVFSVTP